MVKSCVFFCYISTALHIDVDHNDDLVDERLKSEMSLLQKFGRDVALHTCCLLMCVRVHVSPAVSWMPTRRSRLSILKNMYS